MGLFELALVFSVVIALYNFQQIKIILKDKGYNVNMFTGWLGDYRQFKQLMQAETDQEVQIKYRKILNGLLFSSVGAVVFAILILKNRL